MERKLIRNVISVKRYTGIDFSPIFVDEAVTKVTFCSFYRCPKVVGRKSPCDKW